MLERFLRDELAGKYEVLCRYEFSTNSIIIEMRDGLLRQIETITMHDMYLMSQDNFEFTLVFILRGMMRNMDEYRAKEAERLKGE